MTMARPRIYCRWEIPKSIVIIVTAVIADYERRERILKDRNASETVLDKAAELNAIVDTALEDIEPALCKDIVSDITDGRGYKRSSCSLVMQENTYYRRRRKLIHDIAVAMGLI
jgi:hypothetical protein